MNFPLVQRLASLLIALLIFSYIGYQLYNANHIPIRTEVALARTEPDVVQAEGIAVRQETVIEQVADGVVTYVVENGGRVAKGGHLAVTYASAADAAAQEQLKALDSEIATLKRLNSPGDTYAANPESISKQINQSLTSLLVSAEFSGYTGLSAERGDFLYLLNERQIVTGKVKDFNSRIEQLQARRDSLAASFGGQTGVINSPASGYFISRVDGWENVFDYKTVSSVSAEELKEKLASTPAPSNYVGKLCADFKWYYVCTVPRARAAELSEGMSVTVDFPFASASKVPATVSAVNRVDKESDAAVVLEFRELDDSLALIRRETAQIQLNDYEGVIVSQGAVHFETCSKTVEKEDGTQETVSREVQGVYVRHGSELRFKQIFPLYSTESYVICDPSPPPENLFTEETIKLYDEVVVGGTDLYDGKIIR